MNRILVISLLSALCISCSALSGGTQKRHPGPITVIYENDTIISTSDKVRGEPSLAGYSIMIYYDELDSRIINSLQYQAIPEGDGRFRLINDCYFQSEFHIDKKIYILHCTSPYAESGYLHVNNTISTYYQHVVEPKDTVACIYFLDGKIVNSAKDSRKVVNLRQEAVRIDSIAYHASDKVINAYITRLPEQ